MDKSALEWVFDPIPPSGALSGGDVTSYVFPHELDTLVREVIQNSSDQQLDKNEPVRVEFEFQRLRGEARRRLLTAIGWEGIFPHLEDVAQAESLISGRVKKLLAESTDELVVLFIRDFNTRGLHGDEAGTEGNFGPLCRHKLVTTDDKTLGGGSHGLGKAVLWSFSGIATVAFSSVPCHPKDADRLRYIARAELPFHETTVRHAGSGWYGKPVEVPEGSRSDSAWGSGEDLGLEGTGLNRSLKECGTTILIPFFFEPNQEEQRPCAEIAADALASIRRWFWPALHHGSLEAEVIVSEDGREISRSAATSEHGDVRPFVEAWTLPTTGDVATEPMDIAEHEVALTPPKRLGSSESLTGRTIVRVRRAADSESSHPELNKVAYVRGARMVVKYQRPRQLPLDGGGIFGTLRTGLAVDASPESEAVEEFLRASEPPAHDDWKSGTNRLSSEYAKGSKKRLNEFRANVDEAILRLCRTIPPAEGLGPQLLAKLFPAGSGPGSKPAKTAYKVVFGPSSFEAPEWRCSMTVTKPKGATGWSVDGRLKLDSESGRGKRLDVIEVASSTGESSVKDGSFTCRLPEGVDHVEIWVKGIAPAIDLAVASRARLRADVSARAEVAS